MLLYYQCFKFSFALIINTFAFKSVLLRTYFKDRGFELIISSKKTNFT